MSQGPPPNPYQGPAYDPNLGPQFDANDPYLHAAAAAQLNGPSLALMIMAVACGLFQFLALAVNILSVALGAAQAGGGPGFGPAELAFTGGVAIVSGGLGLIVSGVIFYGAMRMRAVENYSLSMVSSILAIIPCFSPCCLIGLPIGIWAVVVLSRPEVKMAFRS